MFTTTQWYLQWFSDVYNNAVIFTIIIICNDVVIFVLFKQQFIQQQQLQKDSEERIAVILFQKNAIFMSTPASQTIMYWYLQLYTMT